MTFPTTMIGHDRTYRPPRALRGKLGSDVTAWELLGLTDDPDASSWATATLDAVVSSIDQSAVDLLGCTDCQDTGFYGVPDPDDEDMLSTLIRRSGNQGYERLTAAGAWTPETPADRLEVLSLDLAGDLAAAVTSGACGLIRRYGYPRAWLPPAPVVSAAPLSYFLGADGEATPQGEWVNLAVVDQVDQGAVFDLVRVTASVLERWEGGDWIPDEDLLMKADLPMVRLDDVQLAEIQSQLNPAIVADAPLTVSPDPRAEKLRRYWSTGKGAAKIRWNTPGDWKRCYRHLSKYMGLRAKGYCQNMHKRNDGVWTGDRRNPGGNGHRGHRLGSGLGASPEETLLASIRARRSNEGKTNMADLHLVDGEYKAADTENEALILALTAGAIPVAPPDEWFDDPHLEKVTTLTIEDNGRVYGHLAPWDITHIGMAGEVPPPPNPDGQYRYYRTGNLVTASGATVRVGQLTLAGGHAPTSGRLTTASVVKHYDDTNSGVADVAAGEDEHGIWVAGALRPTVTPNQIRVMRACPPSGDWRAINGKLELVAACHVNVQGFPIAAACTAGGAQVALVAAGARTMAELMAAERADKVILAQVADLRATVESLVASAAVAEAPEVTNNPAAAATTEVEPVSSSDTSGEVEEEEVELTETELAQAEKISKARELSNRIKKDLLRDRKSAATTAGAMPPQFAANAKKKADDAEDAKDGGKDEADEPADADDSKVYVPGTKSFPIDKDPKKGVPDLKNAVHAFGRAKDPEATKKHIKRMAFKHKRPDLIPSNWK